MDNIEQRTNFERRITRELQVSAPRTRDCMEPDDLMRLIDGNQSDPEIQRLRTHAAHCAFCRREYIELREALWEADRLRPPHYENASPTLAPVEKADYSVPIPEQDAPNQDKPRPFHVLPWLKKRFSFSAVGYALATAATFLLAYFAAIRPLQIQILGLRRTQESLSASFDLRQRLSQEQIVRKAADAQRQLADLRQEQQRMLHQYQSVQTDNVELQGQLAQARRSLDKMKSDTLHPSILKDGGGQLALNNQGRPVRIVPLLSEVQEALKQQRIKVSGLPPELNQSQVHLMGQEGDTSFRLLNPIGKVIERDRPNFRWKPLKGAVSYVVTVLSGAGKEIIKSEAVTQTSWTPPHPLKRGDMYSWYVTARRNDSGDVSEIQAPSNEEQEVKFKVLGKTQAEIFARARRTYAGSHLALGVLYARMGLVDEAKQEFSVLQKENPHSILANNLLSSLQDRRNSGGN